jgi:membrane protein
VLVYWAVMTLGPLMLGASVSLSSYVISASRGLVTSVPGVLQVLFDIIEFFMLAGGLTALYRYVPNTPVRRVHAWAGGVFAALGIEVARRLLAWYLATVPMYSVVYGAFATLPILLVWIYIAWLVVLWGAVIAAYLPSLVAGTRRKGNSPGWRFELSLEVLNALHAARSTERRGLTAGELERSLRLGTLQLEPVLEELVALDMIARINEVEDDAETRYILLADVTSPAAPLVRKLLLPQTPVTGKLWHNGRMDTLQLQDIIEMPGRPVMDSRHVSGPAIKQPQTAPEEIRGTAHGLRAPARP